MIHEALAVKLALFFVIDACAYHDLISGSLKFQNLICNFTNGFIACINAHVPYRVYMMASANKFLRIYYASVKTYLDSLEHN